MVILDHERVDTARAESLEPRYSGFQERTREAAAAVRGIDGDAVDVSSPPVPAGDHGADDCPGIDGNKERARRASDEQIYAGRVIRHCAMRARSLPDISYRLAVGRYGWSDVDWALGPILTHPRKYIVELIAACPNPNFW